MAHATVQLEMKQPWQRTVRKAKSCYWTCAHRLATLALFVSHVHQVLPMLHHVASDVVRVPVRAPCSCRARTSELSSEPADGCCTRLQRSQPASGADKHVQLEMLVQRRRTSRCERGPRPTRRPDPRRPPRARTMGRRLQWDRPCPAVRRRVPPRTSPAHGGNAIERCAAVWCAATTCYTLLQSLWRLCVRTAQGGGRTAAVGCSGSPRWRPAQSCVCAGASPCHDCITALLEIAPHTVGVRVSSRG